MRNKKLKQKNPLVHGLKLLNIRPRSKEELKEALCAGGYSEEEVDHVISYLTRLDYLNDPKFMESWCYYRKYVSPRSRWYVRKELLLKGISAHDLEEYFDQFYPDEEEKNCLERIVEKRTHKLMGKENSCREAEQKKLAASLLRKGFNRSMISEAFHLLQAKQLDIYGKK